MAGTRKLNLCIFERRGFYVSVPQNNYFPHPRHSHCIEQTQLYAPLEKFLKFGDIPGKGIKTGATIFFMSREAVILQNVEVRSGRRQDRRYSSS